MEGFTPLPSLAGGALIGLAAGALWLLLGRVAGVSGILGGALRRRVVVWHTKARERIRELGGRMQNAIAIDDRLWHSFAHTRAHALGHACDTPRCGDDLGQSIERDRRLGREHRLDLRPDAHPARLFVEIIGLAGRRQVNRDV